MTTQLPRRHHSGHLGLLVPVRGQQVRVRRPVDGIVVPTHRDAGRLEFACTLARHFECPLLAVVGGDCRPDDVLALAERRGVRVGITVRDGDARAAPHLPMAVRTVHEATEKQRSIAAARSLGIAVARVAGWSRLLLLDDDIGPPADRRPSAAASRNHRAGAAGAAAARLADRLTAGAAQLHRRLSAVGWRSFWYPDNSVACHAHRLAGHRQDSFVSGALLLVGVDEATGFFPPVYNEDWLFLFDPLRARRVGNGGNVHQLPFDPFADARRAADEEFGDVLAEGLFHLLHEPPDDLETVMRGSVHWERELTFRRAFLEGSADLLARGAAPEGQQDRASAALTSLAAALDTLARIPADDLAQFVNAWRDDRRTWSAAIRHLPVIGSATVALDVLHVSYERTSVRGRT